MNEQNNSLQHYGVPGMKWGVRKAVKIGNTLNKGINNARKRNMETSKYAINKAFHPILSAKADVASMRGQSLGTKMRRSMLYQKTEEVRDINKRVESLIQQRMNKKLSEI